MPDLRVDLAFTDADASNIAAAISVPKRKGPGVTAQDLGELEVETRVFDQRAQTVLQKIAGIVGVSGSVTRLGVVHYASRYTTLRDPAHPRRPEQKWGVAVRLLVASTDISFKGKITLPVVAASAELGMANAQIGMHVRGYKGNLGSLIPAPSSLSVDSYALYMAAFKQIQEKVFSDEAGQAPVLLEAAEKA